MVALRENPGRCGSGRAGAAAALRRGWYWAESSRGGTVGAGESPRVLWRLPIHGRVERWEQHGSIRTSCVTGRSGWCWTWSRTRRLPDRPARHPGQYRRRHPGRGQLVLPRPAQAADHRHHPPARPRHHPRPVRPADHRPHLLPAQAQGRPRRRRLPAPVLPGHGQAPRADLPAAPGLALTTRRAAQGPPATTRTTQDLHPDRDHHRPGHRRPLPPGPALRQPGLARTLRHLAEHHRRPQRPGQRPRSRSPRPARPTPRPRHRRPVHLH